MLIKIAILSYMNLKSPPNNAAVKAGVKCVFSHCSSLFHGCSKSDQKSPVYRSFVLLFLITSFLSFPMVLKSQDLTLGIRVGGMAYNGELNEATIASTLRIVNPSFGVAATYDIIYPLSIELSATYGNLTGDDSFSSREWMNERNLNFETVIYDLDLSLKWMLFRQFGIRSRFDIFPKMGASAFYFNPKTFYRGEWHELRDLGTEGQGNPGYGEKYNNYSFSIKAGGGAEYVLNEVITLGVDFVIGVTQTDYLDDVSGRYVDYDQLVELNGPLAAALSNRTGEYYNSDPVEPRTGARRGNSGDNDHIISGAFYFRYNISYIHRTGRACPRF